MIFKIINSKTKSRAIIGTRPQCEYLKYAVVRCFVKVSERFKDRLFYRSLNNKALKIFRVLCHHSLTCGLDIEGLSQKEMWCGFVYWSLSWYKKPTTLTKECKWLGMKEKEIVKKMISIGRLGNFACCKQRLFYGRGIMIQSKKPRAQRAKLRAKNNPPTGWRTGP